MKNITTAIIAFLICTSITAQNIGIGTTTPNYPLTLRTTNPAQPFGLVQTNGTDSAGLWVNSVYGWLGSITNKPFHIGANNQPGQLTVWPNGNVGLGTVAMPTTKLEINGKIKITDGNQGAGKVLTSDASGEAKWETPATTANNWTTSGIDIYNNNTGNVGIGTSTPLGKFSVEGIGNVAIFGNSPTHIGVYGTSTVGTGISGYSNSLVGTQGVSFSGSGVEGFSNGAGTGGLFSSLSGNALITTTGNVGIGTTSPQAPFTVAPNKTILFGADTLNGGTKMMWLPSKGAFRGGSLVDDPSNIGTETNFWNTDSVGLNSFAFGYNVKAKGVYSTATGAYSTATGEKSTATGFGSEASGVLSTASGLYSRASGTFSIASGQFTTASGVFSIASGNYSTATGDYSIASGVFSKASGKYSTALGDNSYAKAYNSTATGRLNDTIAGSNPTNWIATDPLVTIGNGTSESNRHNALTIYKNGNQDIAGYTRLGEASEGAVRIKTKKLTGTTPNSMNPGTFTFLAHGIADENKILSVSVLVTDGIYQFLPHSPDIGAIYTVNVEWGSIAVGVKTAVQSASVMGKPIKVLITYEE